MSKINKILTFPFQGRLDWKLHFLGCFFLTVWAALFIVWWVAAIIVAGFALLKESVLDATFSSADLWYGYAGIIFALLYLWGASV